MGSKGTVGLRYCGGCNPRFDRTKLVQKLAEAMPEVQFTAAQPGVSYAAVLVVCGCENRCATVSDLAVPAGRLIYLSGWKELPEVRQKLLDATAEKSVCALTREQVLELLPHRPPMLFVDAADRVVPGEEAITRFRVDPGLPFLAGHFPGHPVLPGVLQIEAAAQAAALMLLAKPGNRGKLPVLLRVQNAVFRREVLPGQELEVHASLIEYRPAFARADCRVQLLAGDAPAAELELSLVLREMK